ncbi:MAG: ferredoxin [Mycolicibacterium sp.]|nr:ferredoxin [Mycolicibacterium sp.]
MWLLQGLRNGILTTGWPWHRDDYFSRFVGGVSVKRHQADAKVLDAAEQCPTQAITTTPAVRLDRGRCILCGRCIDLSPRAFDWDCGSATAVPQRGALVVGAIPDTDEHLHQLRDGVAARVRRLRRSLHIRHVDAGSDGSDEWEVAALTNPVYDIARLGIFFTASPRHADLLLITGIGASGMVEPLRRTLVAMPAPVVVIAAGTDAVSGGLIGGGYTGGTGLGEVLDVDVWVPGSPPSPFALLHGILLALGRLPARAGDRR